MRRIGFVGFAGVTALDIIGPMEVFASANGAAGGAGAVYELVVLGATGLVFAAESGVTLQAEVLLEDAPALDTVIVPGGSGLREMGVSGRVARWLREREAGIRRVASVCTGIYALAASGLIDGRRATTHWRFAEDVRWRHPKILLDADAIFTRDGKFATSAGITAGIDLSLALVEEDLGGTVALAVARELVVYLKRSGGQRQYSEPLSFQTKAMDGFGEMRGWIAGHLSEDLTSESLAERAGMSERHFRRKFEARFGISPAAFVERLRLDESRRRLETRSSIEAIGRSVGYASPDAFRRAFERVYGISPAYYRSLFLDSAEKMEMLAKLERL